MSQDVKYVMLPRIDEKPKVIKSQPWYKERLKEKYLTKNKNASNEKILDAKQWIFVKDGLDDFRDGLPPPHNDLIIKPTSKGPRPNIKNESWKYKETILPASNRLTLNQRCYSRKLPLAEAKRENIEQIIIGLAQHPLALYPHLEEALPPDLFEEVLEILDPEMNQPTDGGLNDSGLFSESKPRSTTPSKENKSQEDVIYSARKNIREELEKLEEKLKKENSELRNESEKKTLKNTYKWLLKKEESKAKAKGPEPEQLKAQAIDNHIKKVTEEYCNWVKSLDGEHNIDPITLTSLFASGYDTKPPLSVPIHVVELSNIPAELRPSAYVPPASDTDNIEKNIYRDSPTRSKENSYRYGAWYLPKQHWHFMKSTEKLVDPKVLRDAEKDESKKRSEEINAKLAPLHGAQAFKEFVRNKQPSRVPKLLEELEDWQNEQTLRATTINFIAASQLANGFIHSND